MRLWPILRSRWVVVPAVIALVTVGWNLYVSGHDDGIVLGRVIDPEGQPVAGAQVVFLEQNVATFSEFARIETGPDGRFRFADNRTHHAQVFAEKDGRRSERETLRLWFKSQNTELAQPLVLQP